MRVKNKNMKILIATDSFKGSLSSLEAGRAIEKGINVAMPDAEVTVRPLADGGEGTVDALCEGMDGERVRAQVSGPLGERIGAEYCIVKGTTAVIEMASAAGLPLVPPEKRAPMNTTTFGVGELIADAIARGCRSFIIGIGGSATNDGGTGMLSALGFKFFDKNGREIARGARGLEDLAEISAENALSALKECSFRIACDVNNPLCGERGCSAVFAPQKGASGTDIELMDGWLSRYAALAGGDPEYPGAGAAGGMGFAFMTFLGGSLEPGVDIILSETGLEEHISNCDIAITGEGRIDRQTLMGKAPMGVARLAKKYGRRVIAFCGCLGEGAGECIGRGFDEIYPAADAPTPEDMIKENAERNLMRAASDVFSRS